MSQSIKVESVKKDDEQSPVHPCTDPCTDHHCIAAEAQGAQAPTHYACEWENCTETFDDSDAFLKHLDSHITKRPWVCKWRGCKSVRKSFTEYRSTLLQHVIMHTNYKPHVCRVVGCGFSSPFPWCLKKHERAHARTGTSIGKLVRRRKKLPKMDALLDAAPCAKESAVIDANVSPLIAATAAAATATTISPLVPDANSIGNSSASFSAATAVSTVPCTQAIPAMSPQTAGASGVPHVTLPSVLPSVLAPASLGACKLSNPLVVSNPLSARLYRPATIAIASPVYPFSPLAALCNVATSVLGPNSIKEEHEKANEKKVLAIADLIN